MRLDFLTGLRHQKAAGMHEIAGGTFSRLVKKTADKPRSLLRRNQLESNKPADLAEVQQQMLRWQKATDLAGIRDIDAIAKPFGGRTEGVYEALGGRG